MENIIGYNDEVKDLNQAIKIIAEFDGWEPFSPNHPTLYTRPGFELMRLLEDTSYPHYRYFNFNTSADALLRVYREVRFQAWNLLYDFSKIDEIKVTDCLNTLRILIIDGDYAPACMKLANLILLIKKYNHE